MTREQLRLRYVQAFARHWRTAMDRSGPTPEFLDELVDAAVSFAEAAVKGAVLMQAQPPVLVAASDAIPQETPRTPTSPDRSPTARTRHRTRGGEPR